MPQRHEPARTPEHLMELFAERLNRANLDALMALYEPDAVLQPEPGTVVRGSAAIRAALTQLLALSPKLRSEVRSVLASGDIALVSNAWSLVGTAPDGSEVRQGGLSTDVLRRQPDGSWRVVVDLPAR